MFCSNSGRFRKARQSRLRHPALLLQMEKLFTQFADCTTGHHWLARANRACAQLLVPPLGEVQQLVLLSCKKTAPTLESFAGFVLGQGEM
jgi:hypothetical protein